MLRPSPAHFPSPAHLHRGCLRSRPSNPGSDHQEHLQRAVQHHGHHWRQRPQQFHHLNLRRTRRSNPGRHRQPQLQLPRPFATGRRSLRSRPRAFIRFRHERRRSHHVRLDELQQQQRRRLLGSGDQLEFGLGLARIFQRLGLNLDGLAYYSASGSVVDNNTNAISGATLALSGSNILPQSNTATNGTFIFGSLTENEYTLTVSKLGYASATVTFNIDAANVYLPPIVLTPLTAPTPF